MLTRYLLYGCLGWAMESFFTGAFSLAGGDRNATSKSYLWMHPIYGGTGLLLEWLHDRLARWPLAARLAAYVGVIYAAEYTSGLALRKVIGRCPWDYGRNGVNLHGLIRLDYAPAWAAVALAFEPTREWLASRPSPLGIRDRQLSTGSGPA
jgi:uncharacterized membrane protein